MWCQSDLRPAGRYLSPKAEATSVGFLVGWVAGFVAAVTAFTLLSSLLPEEDPSASKPIQATIILVLGALLILLAVKQWRGRPRGEVARPQGRA